ncbi:MAG: hypothetical protein Q9218_005034 [Villophora microphyllina]
MDFACQCNPTKSAAIASAALGCVVSACGPVTGLAVQGAASSVCDCVKTALPASTTASSTASHASTTAASSPAKTPTPSSSVQLPTKPYPTASSATAATPRGTGSSGSGAGTGSGSVTPFTGGASLVVGSISSIIGALFFAMLALYAEVDPAPISVSPRYNKHEALHGVPLSCMAQLYNSQLDAFDLYHQVQEVNEAKSILGGPALPALGHATAGSTGAAISNLFTYPLALIVTRLQIQRSLCRESTESTEGNYRSLSDAIAKIYKSEDGLAGFYAGLVPDTIKTIADSFLFFLAYNYLRQTRLKARGTAVRHLPVLDELGVGFLAGAFSKLWTTPIANIVTRQQAASMMSNYKHSQHGKSSIRSVASKIRSEKGLRGFWSGYSASLVLTLNPSLTFLLFETLKRLAVPRHRRFNPPPQATFLIAAMSKAIASTVTYPFSLAKSRAQASSKSTNEKDIERKGTAEKVKEESPLKTEEARAEYTRNVFSTIVQIARTEGLGALYEGLGGDVLKGFFSHGFTMLVKQAVHQLIIRLYYVTLRLLKRLPNPQPAVKETSERTQQGLAAAQRSLQPLASSATGKMHETSAALAEKTSKTAAALYGGTDTAVVALKQGTESTAEKTKELLDLVSKQADSIKTQNEG